MQAVELPVRLRPPLSPLVPMAMTAARLLGPPLPVWQVYCQTARLQALPVKLSGLLQPCQALLPGCNAVRPCCQADSLSAPKHSQAAGGCFPN